jgi:D-serine deaminase-like pyridoxal phosphate-dependent protein
MLPGQGVLRVDLAAIVANWRDLCALHGGTVAGVVKADAYGLGAGPVARALRDAGCTMFFVAHLTEGLALREAIGTGPEIVVLNGFPPGADGEAALLPVLNHLGDVEAHGRAGSAALLHLDTGMSRLGLDAREQAVLAQDRARLGRLTLRYVMTHLACADEPEHPLNEAQRIRFAEAASRIAPGVPRSFANSSGIFLGPGFRSGRAARSTASTPRRAGRTRCARWRGWRWRCCRSAGSRPAIPLVTEHPGARRNRAGSRPLRRGMPMATFAACRGARSACCMAAPRPSLAGYRWI